MEETKQVDIDSNVYTQHKIYNDIIQLLDDKVLAGTNSKKQFRTALEQKYSFKKKALKHYAPFDDAMKTVIDKLTAENPENNENNENDKNNKTKKTKKSHKKSRKRKREQCDDVDGDGDDNENDDQQLPPKNKKRRTTKKQPYQYSLTKLKKLLRATHLATPKIYSQLKGESNKKQVDILKDILKENNVPTNNLSEQQIKKIKEEYDLKREMKELGLTLNPNQENISSSSQRPKRNRKKVKYNNPPPPQHEDEKDQDDDHYDDDDDDDYEEEEEEQYVPSDEDEDDDIYHENDNNDD